MKRYTTSSEAYRLYLDAFYLRRKRSGSEALILAKKNYERAIDLDPNFALAYIGLANLEVYSPSRQSYERMKFLSRKAIEIDESLGEAHEAYGFAVWRGDWNWQKAETHFHRAVELSSHTSGGYGSLAMLLSGQGRFDKAINLLDSQNPPDSDTKIYKTAVYYFSRNYEKVVSESQIMLAKSPNDIDTLSYLAVTYPETGDYQKAIETAKKYAALDETVGIGSAVYLGYAYAKAGEKEKAREILQQITSKKIEPTAQIHGGLAMLYGALGEKGAAFEHLEKSIENREWWAFTLKVAPYYDSLRDDAQFEEMLRRVNLAE
jgi:pentatricopeptide repeat protein